MAEHPRSWERRLKGRDRLHVAADRSPPAAMPLCIARHDHAGQTVVATPASGP